MNTLCLGIGIGMGVMFFAASIALFIIMRDLKREHRWQMNKQFEKSYEAGRKFGVEDTTLKLSIEKAVEELHPRLPRDLHTA